MVDETCKYKWYVMNAKATAYKTNWVVKFWIVSNNDGKCPRHPHIFNEEMAKAKLYTPSIYTLYSGRHIGVCV